MILLLLVLAAGQATPQAEVGDAAVALVQCALPRVQAAAAGPETAEAIADAALNACPQPLSRLRSILVRTSGEAEAELGMQMMMGGLRQRFVRAVNERRGLVPRQENDATAWGDCIRGSATALASRADPAEALVDEAMRECADKEAAVRTWLIQRRGAAAADQLMPAIVAETRNIAIQAIQLARSSDGDAD